MATFLITGGTGLVGSEFISFLLPKGHEMIILTRRDPAQFNPPVGVRYLNWAPGRLEMDPEALLRTDYIIHLAGENVGERRWTEKRKQQIRESRVKGCATLVRGLQEMQHQVRAVVCASAIGWYGPDRGTAFTESDPPDTGYLSETCRAWEAAMDPVEQMGIRLVRLRTGIVLSGRGGALTSFARPLRFGIAAILGSGRQVISWIHCDDLCRIYEKASMDEGMQGIFNAVAPQPADNKTFTLTIAKKIRGRFFIPVHVPSFLLKIILGEMSVEILKSATVSAARLKKTGFQFLYPSLDAAVNAIFRQKQ
jgi:uncharacterized protein (TIGR01777 family)